MVKKTKEEQEEEFNKLYKFLTELAEKKKVPKKEEEQPTSSEVNEIIIPDSSVSTLSETTFQDERATSLPKEVNTSTKTEKIIENDVIHKIIYKNKEEKEDKEKEKVSETICKACNKQFQSPRHLTRHYEISERCKKWFSLPAHIQSINVQTPIHYFLNFILQKTITNSINIKQCKFCETTFSNIGNLHKHFRVSVICNRLAFYELEKNIKNNTK